MNIKDKISTVEDFPIKGVKFLDITTLLEDPAAFKYTVDWFSTVISNNNIQSIVAVDARGFIWGGAVASATGVPLFLARKSAKLPGATAEMIYKTEYSSSTIALKINSKIRGPVLVLDDVIATGGTMSAIGQLLTDVWKINPVDQVHGALINLSFIGGKEKLVDQGYRVATMVTY